MSEQGKYVSRKPPSSIEIDLSKLVKKTPSVVVIKDTNKIIKINGDEK